MRITALPIPLAVTLLLAGLYLLTTSGHTYATDEEQVFALAESLVLRGSVVIGEHPDGTPRYSNYGPGQSFLSIPLYVVGRTLAGFFPPEAYAYVTRLPVSWFNPFVTAATARMLALVATRLGYGPGAAAGTALVYGLATIAWPHSKTFFAEPLAAALTFGSFVVALGEPNARPPRRPLLRLLVSGMLAGLACAAKIQAGLGLPFLGLWVLWRSWAAPATRHRPPLARLLPAVSWGCGTLLGFVPLGLYQWAVFGNPLRSAYGAAGGMLDGSMAEGLYGLLVSPGKGIVWYAPPLALLPLGLALLWRRGSQDEAKPLRSVAALCGAIAGATLLFYAKATFWHGDGAWGPRYLNMALPFMALPLAAVLAAGRGSRLALVVALIIAVPVQLGAQLISFNAYFGVQRDATRRYFEPAHSPIAGHLRLAGRQLAAAYALHLAPGTVVLAEGFSYSEGDRERGEQLPRWTLPAARIALRPPANGRAVRLELVASGCLPAPLPPATLRLASADDILADTPACPPRRYALLLPPEPAELTLTTRGWRPAEAGIEREGSLGVYLTRLTATTDDGPLALAGRLLPIPPVPAGPFALRLWASDYRYGHWDLWPWYLAHAGLPAGPALALSLVWGGLGVGLVVIGVLGLQSALTPALSQGERVPEVPSPSGRGLG